MAVGVDRHRHRAEFRLREVGLQQPAVHLKRVERHGVELPEKALPFPLCPDRRVVIVNLLALRFPRHHVGVRVVVRVKLHAGERREVRVHKPLALPRELLFVNVVGVDLVDVVVGFRQAEESPRTALDVHRHRGEVVIHQLRRFTTSENQHRGLIPLAVHRDVLVVVHHRQHRRGVVGLPLVLAHDGSREHVHLTGGKSHHTVSRGVQHAVLVVSDGALRDARLAHRLLFLRHRRRRRTGNRIRLPRSRHHKCRAVNPKPHNRGVRRQHVGRRPRVGQIGFREPHLVMDEPRQEAVRHRHETLQTFGRRGVIERIELLPQLRRRALVNVRPITPGDAVKRHPGGGKLVVRERQLVHQLVNR